MKRYYIFTIILIMLSLIVINCNIIKDTGPIRIYGKVYDTFSGEIIRGVDVKVKVSDGIEYNVETDDRGEWEVIIEGGSNIYVKIYINFEKNKEEYISSVVCRKGEESDGSNTYIMLEEDREIDVDIVKKQDLNINGDSWEDLIHAYRGRNGGGINQVWVKQPEKWVVYDPNHVLDKYSDPKNNEVFNNIMEGFRAIQEYTNNFIKAPSRDEVEIRYETIHWVENGILFEITDGEAYAVEDTNTNDEIYQSGAGASGRSAKGAGGELCASVQGGDNESGIDTVFDGNEITELDRIWGNFNYNKREPGSRMILDEETGKLYETRDWLEIQNLSENNN